jgi:hypothetical protein
MSIGYLASRDTQSESRSGGEYGELVGRRDAGSTTGGEQTALRIANGAVSEYQGYAWHRRLLIYL